MVFTNKIEELPLEINLCVIVTSASGRAELVESLVEKKSIKNLLIEKVLFQSEDDYGTKYYYRWRMDIYHNKCSYNYLPNNIIFSRL